MQAVSDLALALGRELGALDMMEEVVIAVVVTVFGIWWWWRRRGQQQQVAVLPPSPAWGLPVIGHLYLLRPPVHRRLLELSSRLGNAPLMHLRLGSTHCVVASSAEAASELIRGHETSISERPVTAVARQFAYGSSGFAFAPYDTHWRFMKRLCMSELLGPRTVEQLRPVRRAGTVSLVRDALLAASSAAESSSPPMDLTRHLIRLSNTAIIRMVASTVPGSVTDEAQDLVKEVAELVGAFNAADYIAACRGWDIQGLGRRATDVHRRFDALLEDLITHKQLARDAVMVNRNSSSTTTMMQGDKQQHKDLLDILLDKAEDETAEVKLTRDNIKAFIIDVVTAGSDTSAAMVEWMLVELLNHPDALHKVRQEIDAVVGGDRIVSEADLPRLPYLQAAYKETLRLHPAAPIAHRQSSEQITLLVRGSSFTVPPQAAVFINVWAIGRDPAFWEDPEAFRPERFMPGGAAEALEPRGQHFHFMPFGSGRRGCPGMGLALQSVPAVLAALVQCFHWKRQTDNNNQEEDAIIDMEESDGLVCARKNPLLLRPVARLNPFPPVI